MLLQRFVRLLPQEACALVHRHLQQAIEERRSNSSNWQRAEAALRLFFWGGRRIQSNRLWFCTF